MIELHLNISGWLLMALASVHIIFPRYFNWRNELGTLSLINRQVMYVHTFFIALVVLLMGVLCLTSARELLSSDLGKKSHWGWLCSGASGFLSSSLDILRNYGRANGLRRQCILFSLCSGLT